MMPGKRPARCFYLSVANVRDIPHICKFFEEKIKEKSKIFADSKKIGQNKGKKQNKTP